MSDLMNRIDPRTAGYMAFNLVSSISIVCVNKILFKMFGFPYATFTTACHFIVTYLGVLICKYRGYYEPKKLNQCDVLSITIFFIGFVVFNNLSLNHNSIGFYQLMKVLTTPVIAFIQYFAFGEIIPQKLQFALFFVIIGVVLASVSDVEVNMLGSVFAALGIVSTSYYQIYVKTKQKELNASSFQILEYQAPQAAVLAFVITPFLDPTPEDGWLSVLYQGFPEMTGKVMQVLLFSCFLAFCVNLSIFLVVGQTSPISYNVLGHCKLIIILTFGIVYFGEECSVARAIGMVFAVVGIMAYTHLKLYMQDEKMLTPQNPARKEEYSRIIISSGTNTSASTE